MNLKTQLSQTWLVTRRELVDQLRDWRILAPMSILILFFPYLMNYAALRSIAFANQYGGNLVAERIVPFLLMVVGFFPVTVALVVALEAFVGEKERGTLEPMLSSPLADWQIYVGKLTAGSLVPLAASYISIGLYLVGLKLQKIPFPPTDVMIQMLLLTAAQTVLMVSAAMIISTQSTSVRAANLLASFIVIPAALLIQGESALIFWGTNQVLWLAVLVVLIAAALVVRLGLAHFQREALLGREIDVLSPRWVWGIFWERFRGGAGSLGGWYANLGRVTLFSMRFSILLTVALGVFSLFAIQPMTNDLLAGVQQKTADRAEMLTNLQNVVLKDAPSNLSVGYIFGNNVRVAGVILLFGAFSFGVGGLVIYMINFAVIGVVLALAGWMGFSPWGLFLNGILPHGVLELTAVVLATASVLQIGLRLITPQKNTSLGETLLQALADWGQVTLGLVLPFLLVAALIETYITPGLLIQFLKIP